MGQSRTEVTSDLFYDLVSIQYHALKGQELFTRFTRDAQGNPEISRFFDELRQQDIERARRCHEFLAQLSGDGTMGAGTDEPYPTERPQGRQRTGAGTGSTR